MAYRSVDDIIIGIFAHFPDGRKQFKHDQEAVHRFFHDRKATYAVLGGIGFKNGLFPKSEDIDKAYARLTASGLLWSLGGRLDPQEFSAICPDYWNGQVAAKFSAEEQAEIMHLSGQFYASFGMSREAQDCTAARDCQGRR